MMRNLLLLPLLLLPYMLRAQAFWHPANKGIDHFGVSALAVSDAGLVAAMLYDGSTVVSSNDCASWRTANDNIARHIKALIFASTGDLFAGTYNYWRGEPMRIYKSTDLGVTWAVALDNTEGVVRTFARGKNGKLFAGTAGEQSTERGMIYRSVNDGRSWEPTGFDLPVGAIAVKSSGEIFASSFGPSGRGAIYRSTDDGGSWTTLNDTLTTETLIIDRNGVLFAGVGNTIYRSSDDGITWSASDLGVIGYFGVVTLTADSSGNLFAGTGYQGVYRSTDGGVKWERFDNGMLADDILQMVTAPAGYIIAGTGDNSSYHGFYRSNETPLQKTTSAEVLLSQNYPNPVTTRTTIDFTLATDGPVSLKVYSLLGEEIETLLDAYRTAGSYQAHFDLPELATGVYVYQIQAAGQRVTRKMIVK